MAPEVRYVVGLGSNVGDRLATLGLARAQIAELGRVERASSVYESDPVGGPVQRRFLNAALSLDTALDPIALLEALLEIERALGRVRRERWGPRTLDLDLLWSGSRVLTRPELTIPHPRLRERTFALRPLLDVEPGAADPETGTPYAELLSRLDQPRLELRAGPDGWALGP